MRCPQIWGHSRARCPYRVGSVALTDVKIRDAKRGPRPVKLADGRGLHLLITPAGGKLWRLKYRIDGREKQLAIGAYPAVSLSEARRRRDEARELMATGKDPSREKQREQARSRLDAENTFAAIAKEYCDHRKRARKASSFLPSVHAHG